MISGSHTALPWVSTFVRFSDDCWLFFLFTVILFVFFVLVIIVVGVLRWQAYGIDKASIRMTALHKASPKTAFPSHYWPDRELNVLASHALWHARHRAAKFIVSKRIFCASSSSASKFASAT